MTPELYYFRWSHYNEKARWALAWKGVAYTPHLLLPGLHRATARRLTGQTRVPILVLDGQAIPDSTRIIAALEEKFPDPPLYPRDPLLRRRALELEEFFDEELGPDVRRVGAAAAVAAGGVYAPHLFDADVANPLARWAYRALAALRRGDVVRMLQLTPEAVARSWEKIESALARLEREIQPGGYLAGDAFSVADLTAAALLSVVVLPPEFPCLPRRAPPPVVVQMMERFRNRRAWHWTCEMYRHHRAAPATTAAPAPLPSVAPA